MPIAIGMEGLSKKTKENFAEPRAKSKIYLKKKVVVVLKYP